MDESFEKLRHRVLHDPDLQAELQAISENEGFIRRVVEIGREEGIEVDEEAVSEAMREGRSVWIERWI
jgi:hypothetical protein